MDSVGHCNSEFNTMGDWDFDVIERTGEDLVVDLNSQGNLWTALLLMGLTTLLTCITFEV
jgi:hypothetical protein